MSFTNIVTPEWLSAHLTDPTIKILDCTTYMLAQPVGPSKIESGRAQYLKGHIAGAQHVCMEQDFSEPGARFAFTVPSPDTFNRLLQRLGVNHNDHVVLYGHQQMSVVTRIWFVLHAMGHQKISILNGGLALWVKSGLPLSTQLPTVKTSHYKAVPKIERLADINKVSEAITDPQKVLLNALFLYKLAIFFSLFQFNEIFLNLSFISETIKLIVSFDIESFIFSYILTFIFDSILDIYTNYNIRVKTNWLIIIKNLVLCF
jgi:hypothetical protein